MSFLETVSAWFSGKFGTLVKLPYYAIELEVPACVLEHERAVGMCLPRWEVELFAAEVATVRRGWFSVGTALRHSRNILKKTQKSGAIMVILLQRSPVPRWNATPNEMVLFKRAVRNHERMHANTMIRDGTWHVCADEAMWNSFGDTWDRVVAEILKISWYSERLKKYEFDPLVTSKTFVTEILGRVAAVLHAPKNDRKFVAATQLPRDGDGLLKLCEKIEKHWTTSEALLGWLDCIRWSD